MMNTLYTGDNLYMMQGMNSESVDLIYLDPPFNSKRTYSAPVGSKSAGASFKDMWNWEDVDEFYLENMVSKYPSMVTFIRAIEGVHSKAMMAYVTYMAQRIAEMHRILKNTGSIYLHVDPTASHYLKIIMDEIFGKENFRNEIVWCYSHGGKSKDNFARKHDIILRFTKTEKFTFNGKDIGINRDTGVKSKGGKLGKDEFGRPYQDKIVKKTGKVYRYYLDEGKIPEDYWTDINSIQSGSKERTGYPTQKPLALLHRIIKASSNADDVVFDPFCGCATACVASQQLQRKWIGIDIEAKAAEILVERLSDDAGFFKDFIRLTAPQERTDIKKQLPSLTIKQKLFKDQNKKCNACDTMFEIQHFEIDHIIPKSKGGGDYLTNYQLLCSSCNRIKGDRPMEYLRMKIAKRQELLSNNITYGL